MGKLYVARKPCFGEPYFYELKEKMFKKPNPETDITKAWALMRDFGAGRADMMMIYADEKGKGLGLELLEYLKKIFKLILTSWSGSSVPGRDLCLKAGFKKDGDILVYKKEDNNAEISKVKEREEKSDRKEPKEQDRKSQESGGVNADLETDEKG